MDNYDVRNIFCDAISAYSEENWCAGWLIGIEDRIRSLGGGWIIFAGIAGGWPQGYYGEDGWSPLSKVEQTIFNQYLKELIKDE